MKTIYKARVLRVDNVLSSPIHNYAITYLAHSSSNNNNENIRKSEIVRMAIDKFGLFETIQVPQAVNCAI